MKYDVFISYSSKDQKAVEDICRYLEGRDIRCFIASRDIPRGVVWASAIVDALDESSMMLVAFSESFNLSKQVDREIELASEDDKPILTFRLSDTKFSGAKRYYLKNLNWIDAFPSLEKAYEELYSNICKLIGKEEQQHNQVPSESETASESEPKTSSLAKTKRKKSASDDTSVKEKSGSKKRSGTTKKKVDSSSPADNTKTLESQLAFDPIKGEFKSNEDDKPSGGIINGHEWVDLGLPSGIKWATCNVGATRPEECGDYFAWGEIKPKSSYTEDDSQTYRKDSNELFTNGYVDSRGDLTPAKDAARQYWGATWRMPRVEELQELWNNTKVEWTTLNGTNGVLVKSLKNGNSIFLPATGFRSDTSLLHDGSLGGYWSSTIYGDEGYQASILQIPLFSDSIFPHWESPYFGYPIRPVSE